MVGTVGSIVSLAIPSDKKVGWFWNGKTYLEGGIYLPASFGKFNFCGASDIYDDYIVGFCDALSFIYQISSKTYNVITSNIPDATITINSIFVSSSQEIILSGSYKLKNDVVTKGFQTVLNNNYFIIINDIPINTNRKLVEHKVKNKKIKTFLRKR